MEKQDQPNVISLFIKHCLLFRTKERLFWLFGIFVWLDLLVLAYALISIFSPAS